MTNALKVNVWMCGDCGAYHDTQEEAEGCCMKEDKNWLLIKCRKCGKPFEYCVGEQGADDILKDPVCDGCRKTIKEKG